MAAKWLILCAAVALGEALAFAAPSCAIALRYTVLIAAVFVVLMGCGWRVYGAFVLACAAFGFFRAGVHLANQQHIFEQARLWNRGAPLEAVFEVPEEVSVWANKRGGTNIFFKASLGEVPVNVRISRWQGDEVPRMGERWRCAGWLNTDKPERGGRFAYRVVGRGTFARREASAPQWSLPLFLHRLRLDFSRRLGIGLPESSEAVKLVRAIILGERAHLPTETREAFVDAGTIHVFAISGLHVMVVAKILSILLLATLIAPRFLGFALIPLVWLYVVLTGSTPSAIRAALMASIYFAAPLFCRAPDGLIAWAITFLGVHLVDPALLQHVGCQLSFAVVLVLILSVRAARPYGVGVRILVLTLATWAAGIPLVAATFGRYTFGGLVANLLLVPAAECAVIVGSAGLLASYLSSALAAYCNNLAVLFADAMEGVSFLTASLPYAHGTTSPWTWWECLLWYAALALSLWGLRVRGARRPHTR